MARSEPRNEVSVFEVLLGGGIPGVFQCLGGAEDGGWLARVGGCTLPGLVPGVDQQGSPPCCWRCCPQLSSGTDLGLHRDKR